MKRNFQNFIIRIIFKLTLLVNVNTYNTNEINYNINYLSLSSNNYVQSYRNIFNRWPTFFNRNTRSLNVFESPQALAFNNFSAQYSDENSILNSNFTNNKVELENSYNLKIRLFTKIILCKQLFICNFLTNFAFLNLNYFKNRYNLFDHSFYLFSRQHFSGNIRVYV